MKHQLRKKVPRVIGDSRLQVVLLFCAVCIGLGLLRYVPKHQSVLSEETYQENPAFAIDDEMKLRLLTKVNQRSTPLIGKCLLSLLPERSKTPQQLLITDREDYKVQVEKKYMIFFYTPFVLSDPILETQVNALRNELYSNPPETRKQDIRQKMNALLDEHAEFTKAVHELVLFPSQDSSHAPSHHPPHNQHDAHY